MMRLSRFLDPKNIFQIFKIIQKWSHFSCKVTMSLTLELEKTGNFTCWMKMIPFFLSRPKKLKNEDIFCELLFLQKNFFLTLGMLTDGDF